METSLATDGPGRGVSTVIAVVLMVGIVVVLAGVVSVFALGFEGEVNEPAPNIAVDTSYNDDASGEGEWLNMTVESGDRIDTSRLQLRVSGATVTPGGGEATLEDADIIANQVGNELGAGQTIRLSRNEFTDASGTTLSGSENVELQDATVRIVWQIDADSPSQILYECEVEAPSCASE